MGQDAVHAGAILEHELRSGSEAVPGLVVLDAAPVRVRERGVVAQGIVHQRREIGAELHLTEATVKSHVRSLLTKVGLTNRVQLVILAYEAGFVRPGGTA